MAEKTRPTVSNGSVVLDSEYEPLAVSYAADGVAGVPTDTAVIYADATGRQVKVRAGKTATVRGREWFSDASTDAVLTDTTNTSGLPRIDRAVLRLTRATGDIVATVIQGTPAASPATPALTQNATPASGVWDFPLARWQVASGYTSILSTDIVTEAWYLNKGRVLCTNATRPLNAQLGDHAYETDLLRYLVYDGTRWRYTPNQTLFAMSSQAFLFKSAVTNNQLFYTSPDITINPSEAVALSMQAAWGSGAGALNGYVQVEYSNNSGSSWTQLTNLPYAYNTTTGVDWGAGGQCIYQPGSTATKVRFRFTMHPSNTTTAYDVGTTNTQTNLRVWSTGKMNSEIPSS